MKKPLSLCLALLLVVGLFAACNDTVRKETTNNAADATDATQAPAKATALTMLLSAPSQTDAWQEIAETYQTQTGVKVRVTAADADAYAETLDKELNGDNPPAVFEWNPSLRDKTPTDFMTDLKGTGFASFLTDASLALRSGDKVQAVPVDVSVFGILYNGELTERYFALRDKGVSYSSMAEINSFEKLSALVKDMQKHKQDLGVDGVFAAPALDKKDGGVWQQELANAAVYAQAKRTDGALDDIGAFLRDAFDFAYSDNVRRFLDLVVQNADTQAKSLGSRTAADAQNSFRQGKAVFLLAGTDAADALLAGGGTLKAEQVGFLPLYFGAEGESAQGLSVRVERALAVNDKADKATRQAAVDFLEWLFSSEAGKRFVREKLRFRVPFNSFSEEERAGDPLTQTALAALGQNNRESVPEVLDRFLPTQGLERVSNVLLSYLRGERDWDDLVRDAKARWAQMWKDGTELLDN